jgi:hypothetical protein
MFLDEDSRAAAHAGRILMVVLFLFIFSSYKSCEEVKYRVGGETVEGRYTGIQSHSGRRGRVSYSAEYQFVVDGKPYRGGFGIDLEEGPALLAQVTLPVSYLPSDPKSNRPAGSGNWFWIILLLLFLGLAVVFGLQTWKQAQADVARSKR